MRGAARRRWVGALVSFRSEGALSCWWYVERSAVVEVVAMETESELEHEGALVCWVRPGVDEMGLEHARQLV